MELDITAIVRGIEPRDYSASRVELGDDAGAITWGAACRDARALFGDQFNREAFDAYFRGFGAWDDEALAAHTDEESAALMLQFIAGDMRECEFSDWPEAFSAEWWPLYEAAASEGTVCGRIGRADDGCILYYIGS